MRNEKLHLVKYIGTLLQDSDYVYFISYKGVKVKDFSELRGNLAPLGAECHVLKNKLIQKAAEQFGINALGTMEFKDSTALVSGKGDAGAVAKAITEFGKKVEPIKAKGGYFEGAALSSAEVEAIAALPSKEVLQAQLLGVLQGPSRNLVSLLNAKAATILNVLNAYKEKLDK